MDPRIAARRRSVSQLSSRANARRALLILVLVAGLSGIVWVVFSPFFSVRELDVYGVNRSRANEILEEMSITLGEPLILLRTSGAEQALMTDPWISEAEIRIVLPDMVEVWVEERSAAAWLWDGSRYALLSENGVMLLSSPTADTSFPVIRFETPPIEPGERVVSPEVVGSLEFLAGLPSDHAASAQVNWREGEVWAVVGALQVRLGRPIEMAAKAVALTAVLEEGSAPDGSVVTLIAPTRPSVTPPPTEPSISS